MNGENDPMQITMGEKKSKIRNYSSLFDDELVFRDVEQAVTKEI